MSWVVTGGAGFIGTNLVKHLVETGHTPVILDDLSREGVDLNAEFLHRNYGVATQRVDVSDREALWSALDAVGEVEHISHLAGQVSFLKSIDDPVRDFEVNALGTLNVLEYVRTRSPETTVVGMSSNKIYGDLGDVRIVETETRYVAPDFPRGFSESLQVDCHGPYGCSKGLADQYLADYARSYYAITRRKVREVCSRLGACVFVRACGCVRVCACACLRARVCVSGACVRACVRTAFRRLNASYLLRSDSAAHSCSSP